MFMCFVIYIAMPPIKGRMMGLQPATPAYKPARSLSGPLDKKPREFWRGTSFGSVESDEKLKKLRIPEKICRNLPSVKNFCESEDTDVLLVVKDETDDDDTKKVSPSLKRNKSFQAKSLRCQLIAECEHRFPGIIWDVGFLSSGNVFVCYGDGIVICNQNLEVQTTLDRIKLAGGAAVMANGNIVAVDRFNDTINIYSQDGKYISSFSAGSSPMNVAITHDNFIAVTDVGDKCVRVYSVEGTLVNTIAQKGRGYELQWPLYVQVASNDSFIVSDVLQRKIFVFDEHGSFVKALQLKTYGANCVLRPHGICLNQNENFFVVDNALDTVELFRVDDTYVQTILPSEDGSSIKPKVLRTSADGQLVIGGMTGIVKLFRFIESNSKVQAVKVEQPCIMDVKKHDPIGMDSSQGDPELVKDEKDQVHTGDSENYKTEFSNNDCVIIID